MQFCRRNCRTHHGCVDRNSTIGSVTFESAGRTHHGCVDRNTIRGYARGETMSRTHHGCVDRNLIYRLSHPMPGLSHPSRVRGSKPITTTNLISTAVVAPITGAWIETQLSRPTSPSTPGRTHHGCVDRNFEPIARNGRGKRRTHHGCVDRNLHRD